MVSCIRDTPIRWNFSQKWKKVDDLLSAFERGMSKLSEYVKIIFQKFSEKKLSGI
jgi:hypothetical protein